MAPEEVEERDEALAEVTDVGFLLRDLDADGDGDIDIDVPAGTRSANAEAAEVFGDEMEVDP